MIKNWKPVDWVVLVITFSLCVVLVFAMVTSSITGQKMTDEEMQRIENFVMGLVAVIATYVGSKLNTSKDESK